MNTQTVTVPVLYRTGTGKRETDRETEMILKGQLYEVKTMHD